MQSADIFLSQSNGLEIYPSNFLYGPIHEHRHVLQNDNAGNRQCLRTLLLKRPFDKKKICEHPGNLVTLGLLDLLVDQPLIGLHRKRKGAKHSWSNRQRDQQKTVIFFYFMVNCAQKVQPGRYGCSPPGALTGHMNKCADVNTCQILYVTTAAQMTVNNALWTRGRCY